MNEDKIILKKDFLNMDYNIENIKEVKKIIEDYDSYELLDYLEIYNLRSFESCGKIIIILNELEKRFPGIKTEIENKIFINRVKLLQIEKLLKKGN